MKYFDVGAYQALVKAVLDAEAGGDEDAYDDAKSIVRYFQSCSQYVQHVTNMEARMKVAQFRMEPEDYRRLVVELDRARRNYHEGAITSVMLINRNAAFYHVANIYTGAMDDRWQVADFCEEATLYLADITARLTVNA